MDDDRIHIEIHLSNRPPLREVPRPPVGPPIPLPLNGEYVIGQAYEGGRPIDRGRSHAPGFVSVYWYGETYIFTKKQRDVVAALWRAWQDGEDDVEEVSLLEVADSRCPRLCDLFKRHPAWGVMIVRSVSYGGGLGSFRLAPGPADGK